jgi:hypothetical protein
MIIHLSLKLTGKAVPPLVSLRREMLILFSQCLLFHLHLSRVPKNKPSQEMGKNIVTVQVDPRDRKDCMQRSAAWFRKEIINDTATSTPRHCSLQRDAFHLDMGRTGVVATLSGVCASHPLPLPTWTRKKKTVNPRNTEVRIRVCNYGSLRVSIRALIFFCVCLVLCI